MKNLFIVTHTQSEYHIRNEVGGWHDTELSGKGWEDALRVVARLKTMIHHRDVEIFTSDLMRAVETAAPIAGAFNQEEVEMEALREISYGVAEGKPQAWLDSRIVPAPDENRMNHVCIEGGEHAASLRRGYMGRWRISSPAPVKRKLSSRTDLR